MNSYFQRFRLLVVCTMIVSIFAISRLTDPNSTANVNEAYRVRPGIGTYVTHLGHWSYEAAVQSPIAHHAFQRGLITLALLAFAMRSRGVIRWGIASFLVGVLPVAFIPQRGLEAVIVPLFGVMVAIGCLAGRFGWLLAGFLLFWQGTAESRASGFGIREVDRVIIQVIAATERLQPRPDGSEPIVILSDPFEEMNWGDVFVFRLALHDPELNVQRGSAFSGTRARFLVWSDSGWKPAAR